jgi:hypothetical protein
MLALQHRQLWLCQGRIGIAKSSLGYTRIKPVDADFAKELADHRNTVGQDSCSVQFEAQLAVIALGDVHNRILAFKQCSQNHESTGTIQLSNACLGHIHIVSAD